MLGEREEDVKYTIAQRKLGGSPSVYFEIDIYQEGSALS